MKEEKAVVCFGDSNTYGFDPRSMIGDRYPKEERWVDIVCKKAGIPVINEGQNGREIPHSAFLLRMTEEMLEQYYVRYQEIALWIMLGSNDILCGCTAADAAERMECLIRDLQEHFAEEQMRIRLIAPPLMRTGLWADSKQILEESAKLEDQYQRLAEQLDIAFTATSGWNLPVCFDGVHLTEEGHRNFAEHLLKSRTELGIWDSL